MMWRYAAGAVAALLLVAAGTLLFNVRARPASPLPAAPVRTAEQAQAAAELPEAAPEALPKTREQRRFGRYDKDRDGRITREEYLTARRKAFAKLDTNGDGRLSFEEWAIKTTDRFAAADKDRSGAMDAKEFATTAPKRTARPRCECPPAAAAAEE